MINYNPWDNNDFVLMLKNRDKIRRTKNKTKLNEYEVNLSYNLSEVKDK